MRMLATNMTLNCWKLYISHVGSFEDTFQGPYLHHQACDQWRLKTFLMINMTGLHIQLVMLFSKLIYGCHTTDSQNQLLVHHELVKKKKN
jgi:hypothetical protein